MFSLDRQTVKSSDNGSTGLFSIQSFKSISMKQRFNKNCTDARSQVFASRLKIYDKQPHQPNLINLVNQTHKKQKLVNNKP